MPPAIHRYQVADITPRGQTVAESALGCRRASSSSIANSGTFWSPFGKGMSVGRAGNSMTKRYSAHLPQGAGDHGYRSAGGSQTVLLTLLPARQMDFALCSWATALYQATASRPWFLCARSGIVDIQQQTTSRCSSTSPMKSIEVAVFGLHKMRHRSPGSPSNGLAKGLLDDLCVHIRARNKLAGDGGRAKNRIVGRRGDDHSGKISGKLYWLRNEP